MIISDMPDLKKAIRALEVCTSGVQSDLDCTDCPYHDDCESHPMCPMMEMLKDALALLKEQEPRVLSPEEVEALLEDRIEDFLRLIIDSGRSSYMYLQNVYTPKTDQRGKNP